MHHFAINHWRGLLPTRFSLVGILIGLGIALDFLFGALPATLPFAVVALIIAMAGVTLIWQIVGTLRSCERNLKGGGDMILYWGCYGGSIAAALVMVVNMTSMISTTAGANPIPEPQKVQLEVLGDTILIDSFVGFRTHTALLALLEVPENPYTTLRLNSDGGRVFAARAIANALIEQNINTEVAGRCASACTSIFLAGEQRHLLDGGQLGFHQYLQTSSVQVLNTAFEQEKDRAFFRARGVSEAFIAAMFQAEHQDIWFPDRHTLVSAGIVTD